MIAQSNRLALGRKPAAATTVASGGAVKEKLVHTATLVRGRTYVYKGIHFKCQVPQVVDKEMADYLAGQFHEVTDSDGEAIEKPYFDVEYNVPEPVEEEPVKTMHRLPARPRLNR